MAEMKQVLRKLIQSTEEGRVAWRDSSEPGVFLASVGHSTIFVAEYSNLSASNIYLSILDGKGQKIGSALYESGKPSVNSDLVSLYERVQGIATDDPRLDELLEALDAAPPVA